MFCFEEPSRDPTGETPVPRGMGVPPMSDETRSKTKDRERLAQIDKKLLEQDVVLQDVVEKLLPLLNPAPDPPKRRIGFHADEV